MLCRNSPPRPLAFLLLCTVRQSLKTKHFSSASHPRRLKLPSHYSHSNHKSPSLFTRQRTQFQFLVPANPKSALASLLCIPLSWSPPNINLPWSKQRIFWEILKEFPWKSKESSAGTAPADADWDPRGTDSGVSEAIPENGRPGVQTPSQTDLRNKR